MQNNQEAIQEAMRLAKSPAGQQLLQLLQKNGADELRQALSSYTSGDYAQAKQAISALLDTPDARKLLSQLGGSNGSDGR